VFPTHTFELITISFSPHFHFVGAYLNTDANLSLLDVVMTQGEEGKSSTLTILPSQESPTKEYFAAHRTGTIARKPSGVIVKTSLEWDDSKNRVVGDKHMRTRGEMSSFMDEALKKNNPNPFKATFGR
jgi:hypothetical protein